MRNNNLITHPNSQILASICVSIFILMGSVGCGIPSYPYLYPPDAGTQEDEILSFEHDSDNDPSVFLGYEIYYRLYGQDPNVFETDNDTVAENDMQYYFTSSYLINSIITGTSSNAFNYGFRRVIIKPDDTTPPQLEINTSQIDRTFAVEFNSKGPPNYEITLSISYEDEGSFYELFRSAVDPNAPSDIDNNYKQFLLLSDEYDIENDSDIVDSINLDQDSIDLGEVYVAFFAVPYGVDPETLGTLYANGSYEGMEYIGCYQLKS